MRMNDMAFCAKHGGEYPAIEGYDGWIDDGQPAVLDGYRIACGCRVLSTCNNLWGHEPGASNGRSIEHRAAAPISSKWHSHTMAQDEAFVLRYTATGNPVADREYRVLRANGATEAGRTDREGRTHLVTSEAQEVLQIDLQEEGP